MEGYFTILIVDYDAHQGFNLQALLNQLTNYQIIEASSINEALTKIAEQTINLIIIVISDMDSFSTVRNLLINEHAHYIPVIFITNLFNSDNCAPDNSQIGVFDYLTKPVDNNLLLNRVKFYHIIFEREQLLNQSLMQLKVSEQRLNYALEATLDGLWDWDIKNDNFYLSPRFEDMLGTNYSSIISYTSSGLFERLHPEEKEYVTTAYQALLNGSQERINIEYRLKTLDGHWLWVLSRGKVVEHEWRRTANGRYTVPLRAVGTIVDITARIKVEEQLRLSAAAIEHMSDALVILSPDEKIVAVNPAFTRATGYSTEQALTKSISLLNSRRHNKEFFYAMRQSLSETNQWKGEIWNRRANGECYPEWLNATALRNEKGEIIYYICIYSDLSTQDHVRKRLHQLAYYDTLTGLANREMFHDRLASAIANAEREHRLIAVILIDIDRFKDINDNLGHQIGDLVLNSVADRLKNCINNGDTVARFGGDEFTIILSYFADTNHVAMIVDKILTDLNSPFDLIHKHPIYISANIGIGIYPQDGNSLETLLSNVELALYQAKERGRNNYQFCSPRMTEAAQERFRMEIDLRLALERNEFLLYFQPLIDMKRGILSGAEVLVRWQPANSELISPGRFLPVAEEAGLIAAIDDWVLHNACRQVVEWRAQGFIIPRIAVNLSGSAINRKNLLNSIRALLDEIKIPPENLELEISEGFIMNKTENAIFTLDAIRKMEISLAIDDFGTGYSSLSYLKRLPIDHLKIDQSFVRGLPNDPHDASIVRAIIALGKSLGLKIIAEGIEKIEQRDFLLAEGCDEGQGYFFARPMPAKEFVNWIKPK